MGRNCPCMGRNCPCMGRKKRVSLKALLKAFTKNTTKSIFSKSYFK